MSIIRMLLENGRYLMVVVIVALGLTTIAALAWSLYETLATISALLTAYKNASSAISAFIQLVDIYLIVAVLYIFTLTLYELFIGDLKLPSWLVVHNFDGLKAILANVVILIMAVSFAKTFLERRDPLETLLYGIAVTLVSLALIQYTRGHAHGNGSEHN